MQGHPFQISPVGDEASAVSEKRARRIVEQQAGHFAIDSFTLLAVHYRSCFIGQAVDFLVSVSPNKQVTIA